GFRTLGTEFGQHWPDHVVVVALGGAVTLLLGHHDFVNLLPRANADEHLLDRPPVKHHVGDLLDAGRWCSRYVRFAATTGSNRGEDCVNCLIEREEEAGHLPHGQRDRTSLPNLLSEERDDRTA